MLPQKYSDVFMGGGVEVVNKFFIKNEPAAEFFKSLPERLHCEREGLGGGGCKHAAKAAI